jgi:hypothetical protein
MNFTAFLTLLTFLAQFFELVLQPGVSLIQIGKHLTGAVVHALDDLPCRQFIERNKPTGLRHSSPTQHNTALTALDGLLTSLFAFWQRRAHAALQHCCP